VYATRLRQIRFKPRPFRTVSIFFTSWALTTIAALLTQRNIDDAARAAGVSTATLIRWQKLPEFQVAYREARRAAFSQSIARMQQMSGAAVSVLAKIMLYFRRKVRGPIFCVCDKQEQENQIRSLHRKNIRSQAGKHLSDIRERRLRTTIRHESANDNYASTWNAS
jgi:hypothetical protein